MAAPAPVRPEAYRVNPDDVAVAAVADALPEELDEAPTCGHRESRRGSGSFFVRPGRDGRAFRFDPARWHRARFRWSSADRGQR